MGLNLPNKAWLMLTRVQSGVERFCSRLRRLDLNANEYIVLVLVDSQEQTADTS